jgi:hypothetical protein
VRTRGPLLTMAAVGVLAAVVLIVSLARTPASDEAANIVAESPPAPTASPPPPTTPPPAPTRKAVYVGHSSDSEITVAVAVSGEEAAAYICDGDEIEAWLDGTVADDGIELQGRNGTQLTATVSDAAVLGVLTLADEELPFSAAVAGPPAGIYEGKATVDGTPNRIGWIVLPSGRQVGINNAGGNRQPAPRLDPNDIDGLAIAGVEVEVKRIDGAEPVVPR